MSRSRHNSTNSVSLFPFLAVLICAMGALLFLLIVTTQRIRSDAIARAAADEAARSAENPLEELPLEVPIAPEPPPEPKPLVLDTVVRRMVQEEQKPEVIDPNVKLHEVIAQLSAERDANQRQRDVQREQLAAARRRLKASSIQLSERLTRLGSATQEQGGSRETRRELEVSQHELTASVSRAAQRLRTLQGQRPRKDSQYAFIPYDGDSGTTRRPLLIECAHGEIRFLPEEITLTEEHLKGFTDRYNPLRAGVESLAEYWVSRSEQAQTKEPEPYVLILVRPSGCVSYYAARKMLSRLKIPFGYELIEEDWELSLPEPDPEAFAVCRDAVENALANREEVVNTLVVGRGGNNRGLSFRRNFTGGLVVDDEADQLPGTTSSTRSRQPGLRPGTATSSKATGKGVRRDGVRLNTGPKAEGKNLIAENQSAVKQATPIPIGRSRSKPAGTGIGLIQKGRSLSTPTGSPKGKLLPSGTRVIDFPSRGAGRGNKKPAGQSDGQPSGSKNNGRRRTEQGTVAGGVESPSNDTADRHADATQVPSTLTRGTASGSGHIGRKQSARQSGTVDGGSSDCESCPQPDSSTPLTPPVSSPSSHQFRRSRPAKFRWGLSSRSAGIGFEREIPIEIHSDRVIVGSQPAIPVGQRETRLELQERILSGINEHVRSWGKPPKDFYWVPSARYMVNPGGNLHLARLREPLDRWGLKSRVKYTLGPSSSMNQERQGYGTSIFSR
jgi:hypothetical protein